MSNVQKTTSLRQLVRMTLALFLTYLSVAMAMPAVSVHVSQTLGLGNVLSGLAVGIAFLSTILSRGWAGRLPAAIELVAPSQTTRRRYEP